MEGRLAFVLVNPWGVEPQSKEPESFILSIELRVRVWLHAVTLAQGGYKASLARNGKVTLARSGCKVRHFLRHKRHHTLKIAEKNVPVCMKSQGFCVFLQCLVTLTGLALQSKKQ